MSIDVKPEVVIGRPRAEVAAFMFDPSNDAIWTGGVVESKPLQPGRLVKGALVDRVSKFIGRTFGYRYVVIDAAGDDFVVMKVEQPFPMQIRYQLDEAPGGTRASIRAQGDATGFFKMAAPLMAIMVRRNITNDLETLKAYLEGR